MSARLANTYRANRPRELKGKPEGVRLHTYDRATARCVQRSAARKAVGRWDGKPR